MKRAAKQEIARVLMGRTLIAEDGRLVAMGKGELRMPLGITDGAISARFFGVGRREQRLEAACTEKRARQIAFEVMKDIGRGLYLPEQPDAVACLIRYVLTGPAVLVFDYREEIPILTAWAGRSLTGWISRRRALSAFLKKMPKQLKPSTKEAPKDDIEKKKKKERRARKKKIKGAKPAAEAEGTETTQTTEAAAAETAAGQTGTHTTEDNAK